MDIEVRPIARRDIEPFHAALSAVALEKQFLLTSEPPEIGKIADFIRTNVENSYPQYVALAGRQLVGWANIIPSERNSMSHVGTLGMGVIRPYRSQGIGSRLLDCTISHAWRSGLKRLELEVFSDNQPAITLYQKFGYQIEGRKKFARFYDGRYQDILLMAQYRIE